MKKRILIALVLFSLAASAYSQTPDISLFARPNTVWSVGYYNYGNIDYPFSVYYYKLCNASDENNAYPMKGGWSHDGYSIENIDECPVLFNVRITEDSLLYFEYPDRNPVLVFDYKASVGDTITLDGYTEYVHSIYKIVVCDIDTIENEGHQYKMWTLAPSYITLTPEYAQFSDTDVVWDQGCSNIRFSSVWFSEIGSGLGFAEAIIYKQPDLTGGGRTDVLCVWQNESIIFHNASQYDPSSDLSSYPRNYCTMEDITSSKISHIHSISIFPNPTTDKVCVKYDENKLIFAGIFDILGNQIYVSMQNNELDISTLSSGVYYLKFMTKGKIIVEKVIKI